MQPQRPSDTSIGGKAAMQPTTGENVVGVKPTDAAGKFFEVDISFGLNEQANDLKIEDAVCSVNMVKSIVRTSLVGLHGSIKEYISEGDFEISLQVGLVAVDEFGYPIDAYPAEGVSRIHSMLSEPASLYVNSEFLLLFGINKIVVTDYSIQQMTHSNYQLVNIKAISDEDYEIKSNEY
ncbi:MAG: DUF6046 domain-containing protein [Bacteroidales bacterium]